MQRIHAKIALAFACGFAAAAGLPAGISPTAFADDAAHSRLAPSTASTEAPPTEGAATDDSSATATDESAATATATDEVQQGALAVQRALGGSVVNQFPTLQGGSSQTDAPHSPWWKQFAGSLEGGVMSPPLTGPQVGAPPGHWPNWSSQPPLTTFIVPATAEFQTPNPALRPVAALRATAMELDASANRLEELDLYGQADAMRELAQQMRLDARRRANAAESPAETPRPADPAADSPPLSYGGQVMPIDPPRLWQRPSDSPHPARRQWDDGSNRRDRTDRPGSDARLTPTYPAPN